MARLVGVETRRGGGHCSRGIARAPPSRLFRSSRALVANTPNLVLFAGLLIMMPMLVGPRGSGVR